MRAGVAAAVVLAVLVLLPCWGCGSNAAPQGVPTVPVKGKITYKGKPLTQGSITFEPDYGREAHGAIHPDGTFELTTYKDGDGAVPGVHRFAVSGTGTRGREAVPLKFRNTSSSNVEVEVKEGKTEYAIDLN